MPGQQQRSRSGFLVLLTAAGAGSWAPATRAAARLLLRSGSRGTRPVATLLLALCRAARSDLASSRRIRLRSFAAAGGAPTGAAALAIDLAAALGCRPRAAPRCGAAGAAPASASTPAHRLVSCVALSTWSH